MTELEWRGQKLPLYENYEELWSASPFIKTGDRLVFDGLIYYVVVDKEGSVTLLPWTKVSYCG